MANKKKKLKPKHIRNKHAKEMQNPLNEAITLNCDTMKTFEITITTGERQGFIFEVEPTPFETKTFHGKFGQYDNFYHPYPIDGEHSYPDAYVEVSLGYDEESDTTSFACHKIINTINENWQEDDCYQEPDYEAISEHQEKLAYEAQFNYYDEKGRRRNSLYE